MKKITTLFCLCMATTTVNVAQIWTQLTSGTTNQLFGVYFADASNGWAVGSSGINPPGIILHTTDGGVTWNAQAAPNTNNLMGLSLSNASNGWTCGASGTLFNTTNGGTNWNTQTSGTTNTL